MRVTGATMAATASTLAIFMAFMAMGSFIGGRLLREQKDPLKVYVLIEVLLAVSGTASIFFLSSQCPLWYAFETTDTLMRTMYVHFLVTAILSVPTLCIGASFPAIARYAELFADHPAGELSKLYAVNLAGAVIGTIGSGFWLLPSLGLSKTALTSAAVNGLAALAAYIARAKAKPGVSMQPAACAHDNDSNEKPDSFFLYATIVFISSAIAMGLEVVWIRYFPLLIGASVYSFASVIAAVMVGLAMGAWCARALARTRLGTEFLIGIFLLGAFVCLHTFIHAELLIFLLSQNLHVFLSANMPSLSTFQAALISRMTLVVAAAMLPSMFLGSIFPLVIARMKGRASHLTSDAGKLYAWSVCGCVCGPLIVGFVSIPCLGQIYQSGIQSTLRYAAILLFVLSLASAFLARRPSGKVGILVAIAGIVFGGGYFIETLFHSPQINVNHVLRGGYAFFDPSSKHKNKFDRLAPFLGDDSVLFYKEGYNTVVTVGTRRDSNFMFLKNDGKTEASLPIDLSKPTPASDWPTQILLGAIPTILAPRPREVLLIGLGTGATLHAIASSSIVERITVAELEPAVVEASRFFSQINKNVINDSRVDLRIADGRNVLASSSKQYDVIISQPAEPWVGGAADLYSKDFWQLTKSRLSRQGVFCQWIQLYAIDKKHLGVLCRTFASVFPNVYVFRPERAGEIILLGFSGTDKPNLSQAHLRFNLPATKAELLKLDVSTMDEFLATCRMDPPAVDRMCRALAVETAHDGIATDDQVSLEYALPHLIFDQGSLLEANLAEIAKFESSPLKVDESAKRPDE